MIRRKLSLSECAALAAETLPKGILLTSAAGDKVNSMVIGWGTVGVNWGRPVFAAYVRTGRFTRELLDQNPEFTVNIPLGDPDKDAIAVCGGKSGRDMDKLAACGLHTFPGESVTVSIVPEPADEKTYDDTLTVPAEPPRFPVTLESRLKESSREKSAP